MTYGCTSGGFKILCVLCFIFKELRQNYNMHVRKGYRHTKKTILWNRSILPRLGHFLSCSTSAQSVECGEEKKNNWLLPRRGSMPCQEKRSLDYDGSCRNSNTRCNFEVVDDKYEWSRGGRLLTFLTWLIFEFTTQIIPRCASSKTECACLNSVLVLFGWFT